MIRCLLLSSLIAVLALPASSQTIADVDAARDRVRTVRDEARQHKAQAVEREDQRVAAYWRAVESIGDAQLTMLFDLRKILAEQRTTWYHWQPVEGMRQYLLVGENRIWPHGDVRIDAFDEADLIAFLDEKLPGDYAAVLLDVERLPYDVRVGGDEDVEAFQQFMLRLVGTVRAHSPGIEVGAYINYFRVNYPGSNQLKPGHDYARSRLTWTRDGDGLPIDLDPWAALDFIAPGLYFFKDQGDVEGWWENYQEWLVWNHTLNPDVRPMIWPEWHPAGHEGARHTLCPWWADAVRRVSAEFEQAMVFISSSSPNAVGAARDAWMREVLDEQ